MDPVPIADGSGRDIDASHGDDGDPIRTDAATRSRPPP
jgi:hypothetical protein